MTEDDSRSRPSPGHPPRGLGRRKSRLRFWWAFLILAAAALAVRSSMHPGGGSHVAPRARCASNLHLLGLGIELYAQDNRGRYPDSLERLVLSENITPSALICPASSDTAATGANAQQLEADLKRPGHNSYIYLGNGMNVKTAPANAVIAYETHFNHGGAGMNVLYGDGHSEWADGKEAAMILARVAATSRPVTFP